MKAFSFLVGAIHALVQLHSASAAPVDTGLVGRQNYSPGVRFWANADFEGHGRAYRAPEIQWNACYQVGAEFAAGTAGGISSIIVDAKNDCYMYPNTNCNPGGGGDLEVIACGSVYHDLGNPEHSFGDRIQSFKCVYNPSNSWAGWKGRQLSP